MSRIAAAATLIFLCGTGLGAQAVSDVPLESVGERILLHGSNSYTVVEVLRAPDQTLYVRTDAAGRFLDADEERSVLSARNFNAIRAAGPLRAAGRSLLFFDGASDYRLLQIGSDPDYRDWSIRALKGVLLGFVLATYQSSRSAAAALGSKIRYLNHSVAEARLRRATNMYYLSLGLLITTTVWFAADAYLQFGLYPDGTDPGIPKRVEAPLAPSADTLSSARSTVRVADYEAQLMFGFIW